MTLKLLHAQRTVLLEALTGDQSKLGQQQQAKERAEAATAAAAAKENKTVPVAPHPAKLMQLIRDPNGSHVIHMLLDKLPEELLGGIFDVCYNGVRQLGVDQHG